MNEQSTNLSAIPDDELFAKAQRHLAKAVQYTEEAIRRAHERDNTDAWCDFRETKEAMDRACRLGICAGKKHLPGFSVRGPGGK